MTTQLSQAFGRLLDLRNRHKGKSDWRPLSILINVLDFNGYGTGPSIFNLQTGEYRTEVETYDVATVVAFWKLACQALMGRKADRQLLYHVLEADSHKPLTWGNGPDEEFGSYTEWLGYARDCKGKLTRSTLFSAVAILNQATHDHEKDTIIELSMNDGGQGCAVSIRFCDEHIDGPAAMGILLSFICMNLGSDGMTDVAPLDGQAVYDVTNNHHWLKWFSNIGPEGRKQWAQIFGCMYVDFGQDNWIGNDRKATEEKIGDAKFRALETGVGRFAAEYFNPSREADGDYPQQPEFWAQEARRIEELIERDAAEVGNPDGLPR